MTTSEHTPGPWRVGTSGGYNANTIYSGDITDNGICSLYGVPFDTRMQDVPDRYAIGLADARLIAAAPELLEALEAMLQWASGEIGIPVPEMTGGIFGEARAAIAKARGEL